MINIFVLFKILDYRFLRYQYQFHIRQKQPTKACSPWRWFMNIIYTTTLPPLIRIWKGVRNWNGFLCPHTVDCKHTDKILYLLTMDFLSWFTIELEIEVLHTSSGWLWYKYTPLFSNNLASKRKLDEHTYNKYSRLNYNKQGMIVIQSFLQELYSIPFIKVTCIGLKCSVSRWGWDPDAENGALRKRFISLLFSLVKTHLLQED